MMVRDEFYLCSVHYNLLLQHEERILSAVLSALLKSYLYLRCVNIHLLWIDNCDSLLCPLT